ncbi:MAG: accA, partial [Microbacteriaceae bacterium]|nr:accA [Microbacteriaceae bacterium]
LIANRGEIACRIIGTLDRLGITSVAVYSDADAGARHVALADSAVRLGTASAADSYLNGDKIIAAAIAHRAQAIHPGYGFLSENAGFAAACEAAGIVFIGPTSRSIEIMGDKISAKAQVVKRNVPIVPGLAEPGLTDEQLAAAALDIGFPALIKPSAGGGGKGMHLVQEESELADAITAARREAAAFFGDDTLFIERFVQNPRHIEVQVLADEHGTTVHLGERECSLQRRHQKVIEEAPSPLLDEETRARIGQAAVDTANSVGYRGVGTVEFIVSADSPDEFFFMEMNTRLQVEHPVTELVTGYDLVEWQLRVAAGEPLDFTQDDVMLTGHAIEARIYAEDPAHGFLPTGGRVLALTEPTGEGVRVDSSLLRGLTISSDYDPMLAKVIAWAPDRAGALHRLRAALTDTVTLGVTNNVEFLGLLLSDPDVVAGRLDTELIERHLPGFAFGALDDHAVTAGALILQALDTPTPAAGPWGGRGGWRIGAPAPSVFRLDTVPSSKTRIVQTVLCNGTTQATIDDGPPTAASIVLDGDTAQVSIGGSSTRYRFARDGDRLHLATGGRSFTIADRPAARPTTDGRAEAPELRSPMPGSVVAISVEDGSAVDAGASVLSIEAMKMEHVLKAPIRGTVSLKVSLGEQVTGDQILATIIPISGEGQTL